ARRESAEEGGFRPSGQPSGGSGRARARGRASGSGGSLRLASTTARGGPGRERPPRGARTGPVVVPASSESQATYPPRTGWPPRRALIKPGLSRPYVTRKRRRLIAGRRFELDHKLRGHPTAVLYLDALLLGPLADLGRVHPVSRCLAPAARRPPGTACGPAASTDVARQCIAQRLGMLGVQVDLVVRTVETEPDRPL